MADYNQKTTWQNNVEKENFPVLDSKINADVVIIGAGITGVITAYLLTKAGLKVVLLESGEVASGTTAVTTAFITRLVDTPLADLIKTFGKEKAKLIWQSGQNAVEEIKRIVEKENIDCEFQDSSIFVVAADKSHIKDLEEENDAANSLGFKTKIKKDSTSFAPLGYWEVPDQAKFHPLKFVYSLVEKLSEQGVKIFENSAVVELSNLNEQIIAKTAQGEVVAKYALITNHKPFISPKLPWFKKSAVKSYVLEVEIEKNLLPDALFIDTETPYHYFRIDRGEKYDRLILGGEDHSAMMQAEESEHFEALEKFLRAFLKIDNYRVTCKWSGFLMDSPDGLPFIGEYVPNRFLATSFSGNGMATAAISAMIFRDTLTGIKNPWSDIYLPKRIPELKGKFDQGADYIQEFLDFKIGGK